MKSSNLVLPFSVVAGALVIAVGGAFLLRQTPEPQPTPLPAPSPSPTPTPTPQPVEVPGDWLTYRSDELGFSIQYPLNLNMEIREGEISSTGDRYVALDMRGPTQMEETGYSDGIYFSVRTRSYNSGKSLRDYIEEQINREERFEFGSIVKSLEERTINGIRGYTYSTSSAGGSGIITFVYIPIDQNEGKSLVLVIDYFLSDPTGRGFERIVDQMFGSFELI